jgi:uncharacterized protein
MNATLNRRGLRLADVALNRISRRRAGRPSSDHPAAIREVFTMTYAVICIDRPDTEKLRAQARLAHMEYINPHRSKMKIGGALFDDAGERRVGMMFAIDLPSRQAVETFMQEEPYNKAGIFESVIVRRIHVVFPETDPFRFDDLLANERRAAAAG